MPIYEYTCNGCGKEFETLVRQRKVAKLVHTRPSTAVG